jgi:hypothetical protein
MYKLVLNVGDKVRNVNKYSPYNGEVGVVINEDKDIYYVRYQQSQTEQGYIKPSVHKHLTKIEEPTHQCKCVHDEVCDKCARQMQKTLLFPLRYGAGVQTLAEAYGKRKTILKKERRNVITGKTQSEMIKLCGTALGVTQFNTRALGTTTGQAMVKIGEAMMHPNVPVRIVDVDHAITEHGTPRHVANKNFAAIVNHIIKKQGLLGFIVNEAHLVYCPIVTEETYVNI